MCVFALGERNCIEMYQLLGFIHVRGIKMNISVYVLKVTCTWSQPEVTGKPPSPRHGHVIVAVGSVIYLHGGMAGEKFHSDMFSLDTGTRHAFFFFIPGSFEALVVFFNALTCSSENMKWERVKAKGDVPPGTAAHSAVALERNLYIFGGMTTDGASGSMYKFQSGSYKRLTRCRTAFLHRNNNPHIK